MSQEEMLISSFHVFYRQTDTSSYNWVPSTNFNIAFKCRERKASILLILLLLIATG